MKGENERGERNAMDISLAEGDEEPTSSFIFLFILCVG